jgi:hypothetical protein
VREITRAALVKGCSRSPTHLAHLLKDARALVIHALGPSLQGRRTNDRSVFDAWTRRAASHVGTGLAIGAKRRNRLIVTFV